MLHKQLIVIIDDFTNKSLLSDNVHFFDYGLQSEIIKNDLNLDGDFNDYGEIQSYYTNPYNSNNLEQRFFKEVEYQDLVGGSTSESIYLSDKASNNSWEKHIGFEAEGTSSENTPQHGDWVYKSFSERVNDGLEYEVLLIDVDNTDSITLNAHLNELYKDVNNEISGGTTSQLQRLVDVWINQNNTTDVNYLFSALSISIGGSAPSQGESNAIEWMMDNGVIVAQSIGNVGQSGSSWGSVYEDVVNVGAWNIDDNGNSLAGDYAQLTDVDVYADGLTADYVDWGMWTFGTSFSTPRVVADFVNVIQIDVDTMNANNYLNEPLTLKKSTIDYKEYINDKISSISTQVVPDVNNLVTIKPVNVSNVDFFADTLQITNIDLGSYSMVLENYYQLLSSYEDVLNNNVEYREYIDKNYKYWSSEVTQNNTLDFKYVSELLQSKDTADYVFKSIKKT
jgi:hypothetical protein